MPSRYSPRLSVEISSETHLRLQNRIPWGLQGQVMRILLEDLLDLVDKHGELVLAAVLKRVITAKDIVTGLDATIRKEEQSGTVGHQKEHI